MEHSPQNSSKEAKKSNSKELNNSSGFDLDLSAGNTMPPPPFQLQAEGGGLTDQQVEQDAVASLSNVIQRVETEEDRIIRILGNRGIEITAEQAAYYANELQNADPNTEIQVVGHHRALKRNVKGILSSIHRRPPSSAHNMRVSPEFGPMGESEDSMMSEGRFPLTGGILSQDVTITASDLNHIADRANLRGVMGGSAGQMSEIANSEWLHAVAHSLDGPDAPVNLRAGPHSLNTAMIPFESAVKKLLQSGKVVDYSVSFFTEEINSLPYIHHVEIGIQPGATTMQYWTLSVNPERVDEFINGQVLAEIVQAANAFVVESTGH